jgi:hypothetical protein
MSLVQSATNGFSTTINIVYGSNNTIGNLLLCIVSNNASTSVPGISDSQGNSWVLIDSFFSRSDHTGTDDLFAAYQCKAGANTVTLTGTNAQTQVIIAEYSDNVQVGGLNVKSNNTGAGTAINAGSITTDAPNELLILYGANNSNNSVTYTGTGGFTNRVTFFSTYLSDQLASGIATFAATQTISASVLQWSGGVVSFIIGGSTVVPSPIYLGSSATYPAAMSGGNVVTLAYTVTAKGSLLFLYAANDVPISLSDTGGNTWLLSPGYGSGQYTVLWYCYTKAIGSTTMTVQYSGSQANPYVVASEYSVGSTLDFTAINAPGVNVLSMSQAIITNFNNELNVMFGNGYGNSIFTSTSGLTLRRNSEIAGGGQHSAVFVGDRPAATKGVYAETGTMATSTGNGSQFAFVTLYFSSARSRTLMGVGL